jgi:hypothetical protein
MLPLLCTPTPKPKNGGSHFCGSWSLLGFGLLRAAFASAASNTACAAADIAAEVNFKALLPLLLLLLLLLLPLLCSPDAAAAAAAASAAAATPFAPPTSRTAAARVCSGAVETSGSMFVKPKLVRPWGRQATATDSC